MLMYGYEQVAYDFITVLKLKMISKITMYRIVIVRFLLHIMID